jgi:hypothetical protein
MAARAAVRSIAIAVFVLASPSAWRPVTAAAQAPGLDPTVDELLARASAYLAAFVEQFSNVVSEERYLQEVSMGTAGASLARQRRDLRSDFLLVKPAGSPLWMPFRDVYEVDGSPVRDRQERLARLFIESPATAVEQAQRIADESGRFNLGDIRRTVNNPVLALAFLQAHTRPRFRYERGRRDGGDGPLVWIVEYRERSRPTLIKGAYDRDMPAQGRYWIDAPTGRVLRSELALSDVSVNAQVTTRFAFDERLQIAVPVQMDETYALGSGRTVSGRATYGRFRRFDVSTSESIDQPRR